MAKEFFHPSVTADLVCVTADNKLLLIRRSSEAKAFPNHHALPGGFMDSDDDNIECAAARELKEETGVENPRLSLVGIYTDKGRDPRGPVHSTAFLVRLDENQTKQIAAGDDASEANLWDISVSRSDIDETRITLTLDSPYGHSEIWITGKHVVDKFGISRKEVRQDTYNSGKLAFDHARIIAEALTSPAFMK